MPGRNESRKGDATLLRTAVDAEDALLREIRIPPTPRDNVCDDGANLRQVLSYARRDIRLGVEGDLNVAPTSTWMVYLSYNLQGVAPAKGRRTQGRSISLGGSGSLAPDPISFLLRGVRRRILHPSRASYQGTCVLHWGRASVCSLPTNYLHHETAEWCFFGQHAGRLARTRSGKQPKFFRDGSYGPKSLSLQLKV